MDGIPPNCSFVTGSVSGNRYPKVSVKLNVPFAVALTKGSSGPKVPEQGPSLNDTKGTSRNGLQASLE